MTVEQWPWLRRHDECKKCGTWKSYKRDENTGEIAEALPGRCYDPAICTNTDLINSKRTSQNDGLQRIGQQIA